APESVETDRCRIRCYLPGDGPKLCAATNTTYTHLKPWMPWAIGDQTPENAEILVRQFRGRWLLANDFILGIWTLDGSRLIGGTGFHLRHGPLSLGIAEIGMWIHVDEAGQGLGTHVLETLVFWGFSEWPWRRLVWQCDGRNLASRRVAEKCGFQLEGITRKDSQDPQGQIRDTARYALLK
ncbi:MAG: GNAT family protein, partial [Myxococcota bacterium]